MKRLWIKFIASLPIAETTVLIVDGKAVVTRGKANSALASEVQGLASSSGVTIACIHGSEAGSAGHKLSIFGIPDNLHQRFRNVWAANWK